MRKLCAVLCALLAACAQVAHGYHVLCILALPSPSHHHLGKGLVNALLKAGHEVTWVTAYPPKETKKGLHIIDGSATLPISASVNVMDGKKTLDFSVIRKFATDVSATTAQIPALKEALVNGHFDAVVTEQFVTDVDSGYAAVLQVPWILLSGVVIQPQTEALIDEVRSVPIIPLTFNDFSIPMSFLQRLQNVFLYNTIYFSNWWHRSADLQNYEKLFSPIAAARNVALTPLETACSNISILFINSHPSLSYATSLPPNAVEIGGYHIDDTIVPLTKDLETILDGSPQGVIYFSMGSLLKSSLLPAATKTALFQLFSELPYTVLWKVEEEMTGLPKNVHTRKWMPQAAILSHKNTRVFITHGGLLSNLETIRYGVPIIAMPVFGDQPANAARAVRNGYALVVEYDTDTMAEGLRVALKEALGTDKYYKRAKYLSSLFNKRPVAPSQLISHYVEVAIESKGAYHLRSKATLYHWYQRWMLDILLLLLVAAFVVYTIVKTLIKLVINSLTGGNSKVPAKKNHKKKNN